MKKMLLIHAKFNQVSCILSDKPIYNHVFIIVTT